MLKKFATLSFILLLCGCSLTDTVYWQHNPFNPGTIVVATRTIGPGEKISSDAVKDVETMQFLIDRNAYTGSSCVIGRKAGTKIRRGETICCGRHLAPWGTE